MPGRHGDSDSQNAADAGTFETLRDEGEYFVHVKQYQKAIESFTKALDMNMEDKNCLVTRSKCWLQLGNAENALTDAEASLREDKDFIRGLYQKAEALYQLGDFEMALVFFHRGHKLRPELQELRMGIQKAEEAIKNSIGSPDSVKLQATGDLSYFFKHEEQKELAQKAMSAKGKPSYGDTKAKQSKGTYQKPGAKKEAKKEREKPKSDADQKTIKQLLGELYGDKEYLEKLMKDSSLTGGRSTMERDIKDKVYDGLEYLHSRADFWRQQKPMYARKRDKEKSRRSAKSQSRDPRSYILRSLDEIEEDQSEGKYEQSLKKAQKVLKQVESMSSDELQNRPEIMATLYSSIGNAYLEMNNFSRAMEYHERDLELSKEHDLEDAKSRALDNLGRVYARKGSFQKAIEVWSEKIPMSKSPLESAWLFHEIGRCHLELSQYVDAKDNGRKALEAAKEAEDDTWKLHASVLVAQSEVKNGELQAAASSFEESLEIAKALGDNVAEQAIKKALDEVNDKIVRGEGEEEEEGEQRPGTAGSAKVDSRPVSGENKAGAYEDDFEDEDLVVKAELDMLWESKNPSSVGSQTSESSDSPAVRQNITIERRMTEEFSEFWIDKNLLTSQGALEDEVFDLKVDGQTVAKTDLLHTTIDSALPLIKEHGLVTKDLLNKTGKHSDSDFGHHLRRDKLALLQPNDSFNKMRRRSNDAEYRYHRPASRLSQEPDRLTLQNIKAFNRSLSYNVITPDKWSVESVTTAVDIEKASRITESLQGGMSTNSIMSMASRLDSITTGYRRDRLSAKSDAQTFDNTVHTTFPKSRNKGYDLRKTHFMQRFAQDKGSTKIVQKLPVLFTSQNNTLKGRRRSTIMIQTKGTTSSLKNRSSLSYKEGISQTKDFKMKKAPLPNRHDTKNLQQSPYHNRSQNFPKQQTKMETNRNIAVKIVGGSNGQRKDVQVVRSLNQLTSNQKTQMESKGKLNRPSRFISGNVKRLSQGQHLLSKRNNVQKRSIALDQENQHKAQKKGDESQYSHNNKRQKDDESISKSDVSSISILSQTGETSSNPDAHGSAISRQKTNESESRTDGSDKAVSCQIKDESISETDIRVIETEGQIKKVTDNIAMVTKGQIKKTTDDLAIETEGQIKKVSGLKTDDGTIEANGRITDDATSETDFGCVETENGTAQESEPSGMATSGQEKDASTLQIDKSESETNVDGIDSQEQITDESSLKADDPDIVKSRQIEEKPFSKRSFKDNATPDWKKENPVSKISVSDKATNETVSEINLSDKSTSDWIKEGSVSKSDEKDFELLSQIKDVSVSKTNLDDMTALCQISEECVSTTDIINMTSSGQTREESVSKSNSPSGHTENDPGCEDESPRKMSVHVHKRNKTIDSKEEIFGNEDEIRLEEQQLEQIVEGVAKESAEELYDKALTSAVVTVHETIRVIGGVDLPDCGTNDSILSVNSHDKRSKSVSEDDSPSEDPYSEIPESNDHLLHDKTDMLVVEVNKEHALKQPLFHDKDTVPLELNETCDDATIAPSDDRKTESSQLTDQTTSVIEASVTNPTSPEKDLPSETKDNIELTNGSLSKDNINFPCAREDTTNDKESNVQLLAEKEAQCSESRVEKCGDSSDVQSEMNFDEKTDEIEILQKTNSESCLEKSGDGLNVKAQVNTDETQDQVDIPQKISLDDGTAMEGLKSISQGHRQRSPDASVKTPRGSARRKSPVKPPTTPLGSRGRSPTKSPSKSPAPSRFSPTKDRLSSPVKRSSVSFHDDSGSQKGKRSRTPSAKGNRKNRTPSPKGKAKGKGKSRTPSPKDKSKRRSPSPQTKQIEVEKDAKEPDSQLGSPRNSESEEDNQKDDEDDRKAIKD